MKAAGTRVSLLSVCLDPLGMGASVERCVSLCRSGAATHTVVPINAAIVVAARSNIELRSACLNADLALADGAAVVWAARLAGEHIPERVPGIDLMQQLIQRAEQYGFAVYFLGATSSTLGRLISIYQEQFPQLRIAGYQHGYFDRSKEGEVATSVKASGAQILFVGMPSPHKEIWAERYKHSLGVSVVLGVGGSFDVVAGLIPRSPKWLQSIGMEWFWRLLCEPRRLWKRYLLSNSYFIALTLGLLIKRIARSIARQYRRLAAGEKGMGGH